MKPATSILLALTTMSFASLAAAEAPAPRYAQLPVGSITPLPAKAPGFVPRGASVPGMHVRKAGGDNPDIVDVASTATREDATPENTRTCFAEMAPDALENARNVGFGGARTFEWSDAGLAADVQLYRRSKDFPQGGVTAVHMERFEERSGVPFLEIVDAWVDPATRGARVVAQRSLPLALVASSAFGVRVFAMRDERPNAKVVQFVLVPEDRHRFDGMSSMVGMPGDGQSMARSQCGHLRLGVPVTEEGASAQLITTIVFRETKTEPKGELAVVLEHRGKRRRPLPHADTEKKFRALTAQVSVSRTTRDPEPVASVSFGWAARESSDRFF